MKHPEYPIILTAHAFDRMAEAGLHLAQVKWMLHHSIEEPRTKGEKRHFNDYKRDVHGYKTFEQTTYYRHGTYQFVVRTTKSSRPPHPIVNLVITIHDQQQSKLAWRRIWKTKKVRGKKNVQTLQTASEW